MKNKWKSWYTKAQTTDSVQNILLFLYWSNFFNSIKERQNILKWICCLCLYIHFSTYFSSSCQIYQNPSFLSPSLSLSLYIYICVCVCVCVFVCDTFLWKYICIYIYIWGWLEGFLFNSDYNLTKLSAKKGSIWYHFLSLWYESTWDWILVTQSIDKHSNHNTNWPVIYIYIYIVGVFMAYELTCWMASLNFSCAITFTFRLISLAKVWIHSALPLLWVKWYHYSFYTHAHTYTHIYMYIYIYI